MLLQLSQIFPLCPPSLITPTPSGDPHAVVHGHGSRVYVLWLLYSLGCALAPMTIL